MDIVKYNRKAWNKESEIGNKWTKPVDAETIAKAREEEWSVLLTPNKPVPKDWFPPLKGAKLLCLASGGGQQGPIFAALGAEVTTFDNSDAQLEADRLVAEREGLSIRLVQGDMRDLSAFADDEFDIIFHAISNPFVDEIQPVWDESYRVLKPGGCLLAGFTNPLIYIFDPFLEEKGILEVKYKIPYSDLEQLSQADLEHYMKKEEPLEFGHSLEAQIGGVCKAGFVIAGFYEDNYNGQRPMDKHIDTFCAFRALKL